MMQLRELRLTGPKARPAIAKFQPGLNVFSGASNTGKSYILRCVDYILGAEKMAKVIDEAAEYDEVVLELENSIGQVVTLRRSLAGGDIEWFNAPIDGIKEGSGQRLLPKKKSKSARLDLSTVLLKFCGIPPAQVRKNVNGKKQALTFRTISHLFIVDENAIIEEATPLLGKGGYDETAKVNAFSFMLTGKDDSAVVTATDPTLAKVAVRAKVDVIERLLKPVEERLSNLPADDRTTDERIEVLNTKIDEISGALAEDEGVLKSTRDHRSRVIVDKQKAESQIVALEQVDSRFRLLAERYASDLRRLDFVVGASYYFDQLQEIDCPLCGQVMSTEHASGKHKLAEFKAFQRAAKAEAAKIRGLEAELVGSLDDLTARLSAQKRTADTLKDELDDLDGRIRERGGTRLTELRNQLSALFEARLAVESEQSDRSQAESLRALRDEIEQSEEPAKKREWAGLDQGAVDALCREIEAVLEEWSWRRPGRVNFDFRENDIVVDGKPRQSNGKGVRALLHAAFSVGLLRYAAGLERPHPGFLMLDSPLTTFKEGRTVDGSENLGEEIEQAFFGALVKLPKALQVIVLENKVPKPQLQRLMRYEYFSGVEGQGRTGFIPDGAAV